jgi:serine/threonine protein phosphatase PrpC
MDSSSSPIGVDPIDANSNPQTETLRGLPDDAPARVGGLTDVGRVREFNEDNLHWEDLDEHTALYAVADSNMGTTLCAALVQKDHAIITNVGDSRVYLMRQGELSRISQDHSLVGFLETLGELTPAEARTHPSGNILVRSIGSVPEVEIDVFHVETQDGDRILLCSDGLWGEVEDHEIAATLIATNDCQSACVELVDMANEAGGKDNSTLVLVTI